MKKNIPILSILLSLLIWIPPRVLGAPILLVDDDCQSCDFGFPPDSRPFYTNALNLGGFSGQYDIWSVPNGSNGPSAGAMAPYSLVIWFTGGHYSPTLTPTDESALTTYLNGGGKLFLISQEYLTDLCGWGNPSCSFNPSEFPRSKLKVQTASTDPIGLYDMTLIGNAGSIGDGMTLSLSGISPIYQYYDRFTPTTSAMEILDDDTGSLAVQDIVGSCQVVFFSFPFENIIDGSSTHTKTEVMQGVLTCMGFTPPTNDMGIASIDVPGPGPWITPETALRPRATITNYTSSEKNNIIVTCRIDSIGGGTVYQNTITITDTLNGGESRSLLYPFWMPGPEGASYTISFYHNLPDDNISNDTLSKTVTTTWVLIYDDCTESQGVTNFAGALLAKRMTPGAFPYMVDSVTLYITDDGTPGKLFYVRLYPGGMSPPATPVDYITPIPRSGASGNTWVVVPIPTDSVIINSGNFYFAVQFTSGPDGPYIGADCGIPWYQRDWMTINSSPPYSWMQNNNPMIDWAYKNLMMRAYGHLTEPVAHDVGVTQIAIVNPLCSGRFYNIGARIFNYGNIVESIQVDLVIVNDSIPSDTVFTASTNVTNLMPDSSKFAVFPSWQVPPQDSTYYRITACAILPGDTNSTDNCLERTIFARICTGVEESEYLLIPKSYHLGNSQPNPMNRRTTLSYALPEMSSVSLKIYDLTGREVRTLANGVREPGYHKATWDGRDDEGKDLSSGIYFYRLSTSTGFTQTRKLLLIR